AIRRPAAAAAARMASPRTTAGCPDEQPDAAQPAAVAAAPLSARLAEAPRRDSHHERSPHGTARLSPEFPLAQAGAHLPGVTAPRRAPRDPQGQVQQPGRLPLRALDRHRPDRSRQARHQLTRGPQLRLPHRRDRRGREVRAAAHPAAGGRTAGRHRRRPGPAADAARRPETAARGHPAPRLAARQRGPAQGRRSAAAHRRCRARRTVANPTEAPTCASPFPTGTATAANQSTPRSLAMYSPKIPEHLIPRLYQAARAQKRPMTRLAADAIQRYLEEHEPVEVALDGV